MIVAWREVPGAGVTPKSRPVRYDMIRAGVLQRFEDWREEISNVVSLSNKLATGDGVFSVGISQERSIALSSSSITIGRKPSRRVLAFLKKDGPHFDEKSCGISCARTHRVTFHRKFSLVRRSAFSVWRLAFGDAGGRTFGFVFKG